jgi:hypothetical protein
MAETADTYKAEIHNVEPKSEEPRTVTEVVTEYTDPDLREATDEFAEDIVAEIVPLMPIVLPLVGGVLMFLLAFIAIYMA